MSPGLALKRCASSAAAAARRDDLALVEEGVGDGDRLVEQAARVVAQVEHDARSLSPSLLLDLVDRVAAGRRSVCSVNEVMRM